MLQLFGKQANSIEFTTAELIAAAFFFACRGCEYVTVPKGATRKTRRLRLRNLQFHSADRQRLLMSDRNTVDQAFYVSITFEDQKNGRKMATRTHQVSGDKVLCPVRLWANITFRILQHPRATADTYVNCFFMPGAKPSDAPIEISMDTTREMLRTTVSLLGGREKLGYDAADVGNKSLRSGAAMSLVMSGQSVFKIQMLGRWESTAFIIYVRPQVMEFTSGMAADMIKSIDWFHVTAATNQYALENATVTTQQHPNLDILQTAEMTAIRAPELVDNENGLDDNPYLGQSPNDPLLPHDTDRSGVVQNPGMAGGNMFFPSFASFH